MATFLHPTACGRPPTGVLGRPFAQRDSSPIIRFREGTLERRQDLVGPGEHNAASNQGEPVKSDNSWRIMPIAVKPCDGRFNDEVLAALSSNRDRAQWANHTCEVCGLAVGASLEKGKWVPEQHWPSVKYQPRNAGKKPRASAGVTDIAGSTDEAALAESDSVSIHLVRS
jgi:hypothetical protein